VEQSAILAGGGQIGPDDFLGQRMSAVIEVGRGSAGDTGKLNRRAEQAGALHADTDHAEAHGVTGGDAAKLERLGGERYTRRSGTHFEKFAAGPSGFFHGD